MQSAISPSFNVRRIRSIASTLLCFAILFAAEAPTVSACTSTYLNTYSDGDYMYADAQMSVSGCNPCYAQIDLTLTSPSSRSAHTTVYNNPGQTSIEAWVSLTINSEAGTWTSSADYSSDNTYYRTQTANLRKIWAYYKLSSNGTPLNTFSRCNPNNACDTLFSSLSYNFALFVVWEVTIGSTYTCAAANAQVQEVNMCYSPDTIP
jgi:hypothetical protein